MIQDNLDQAEKWLHENETTPRNMVKREFFSKYELEQLEEDYGAPDKEEWHDHESGVAYWEEV